MIDSKNKVKIIIQIFLVILISYLVGFCYENFSLIKNRIFNENYNIENSISYTNLKKNKEGHYFTNEDISIIQFDFNKKYINKIVFNYKSSENFKWTIKTIEKDYYGNYNEKVIEGISSNKINIFSEKFDNNITTLTFKTEVKNIELYDFKIVNEINYFNNVILVIILFGLSLYLCIKFRKIFTKNVEIFFVILTLFSGISIISAMPVSIGTSWDDETHFHRIYGLSNDYFSEAGYELTQVTQTNFGMFNTVEEQNAYKSHLNESNKIKTDIPTNIKLTYQNICYIIPSILYKIGSLIGIDFSTIFSLGKFLNLLVYTIIMYFAIKKIPKGKYLMCVISLLPTALFVASNYSYDYFVTAFTMLGFSYFYYEFSKSDKKISPLNLIISLTSFIFASLPKAVYIPFILLLLLLPKEKFYNDKQCKKFKTSVIIIFILVMSTFLLPTLLGTMEADSRGGNTSVSEQLKLILKQPISFIKVFKDNVIISSNDKFFGEIGTTMYSYFGIISDKNIYYFIILLLIISININEQETERNFKIKEKIYILIILIFIVCMIWGSMYLLFTPVGSTVINGVQNRYFIPLIFPLLWLLNSNKIICKFKMENTYLCYSIMLTIISFYSILIMIV